MTSWIIWLIIAAVLVVIELSFGAFAAFCPAIGALGATIAAALGASLEWQIVTLVAVASISFIALKPLINKNRFHGHEYSSNMDALIGREAKVTESYRADGHTGRMLLDGANWQIESTDGAPIERGTLVRVAGYDSIILKVKPINK